MSDELAKTPVETYSYNAVFKTWLQTSANDEQTNEAMLAKNRSSNFGKEETQSLKIVKKISSLVETGFFADSTSEVKNASENDSENTLGSEI